MNVRVGVLFIGLCTVQKYGWHCIFGSWMNTSVIAWWRDFGCNIWKIDSKDEDFSFKRRGKGNKPVPWNQNSYSLKKKECNNV